jgi:hypothetical protein
MHREANEFFLSNAGRISLFTDEAGRIVKSMPTIEQSRVNRAIRLIL